LDRQAVLKGFLCRDEFWAELCLWRLPESRHFLQPLQQLAARFLWVPALLLHLPRFLLDLTEFKGDVRFLKCALIIINTYSPSLIRFLSFTFNTHIPYFSDF